jgi:2-haloacid dehalogenase
MAQVGAIFVRIISKPLNLDPCAGSKPALTAMSDRRLAILSNGSPQMLAGLVQNRGLNRLFSDVQGDADADGRTGL